MREGKRAASNVDSAGMASWLKYWPFVLSLGMQPETCVCISTCVHVSILPMRF